jgi:hypothetical protein
MYGDVHTMFAGSLTGTNSGCSCLYGSAVPRRIRQIQVIGDEALYGRSIVEHLCETPNPSSSSDQNRVRILCFGCSVASGEFIYLRTTSPASSWYWGYYLPTGTWRHTTALLSDTIITGTLTITPVTTAGTVQGGIAGTISTTAIKGFTQGISQSI